MKTEYRSLGCLLLLAAVSRKDTSATPHRRPLSTDWSLATGRRVVHSYLANGAQAADIEGGGAMTEEEWSEYCALLASGRLTKAVTLRLSLPGRGVVDEAKMQSALAAEPEPDLVLKYLNRVDGGANARRWDNYVIGELLRRGIRQIAHVHLSGEIEMREIKPFTR